MVAPAVDADLVFLANGLVDGWLVALVGRAFVGKAKVWRVAMAGAVGGAYSVLVLFPVMWPVSGLVGKVIASVLIVGAAFWPMRGLAFLRSLGGFYVAAFLSAGISYGIAGLFGGLSGPFSLPLAMGMGAPFCWLLAGALRKQLLARRKSMGIVTVEIRAGEGHATCAALVDTGNRARDPITRCPVLFAERSALETLVPRYLLSAFTGPAESFFDRLPDDLDREWARRVRLVPCTPVGSKGLLMAGFRAEVSFPGAREMATVSVVVGVVDHPLSRTGDYRALLPPDLFEVPEPLPPERVNQALLASVRAGSDGGERG